MTVDARSSDPAAYDSFCESTNDPEHEEPVISIESRLDATTLQFRWQCSLCEHRSPWLSSIDNVRASGALHRNLHLTRSITP